MFADRKSHYNNIIILQTETPYEKYHYLSYIVVNFCPHTHYTTDFRKCQFTLTTKPGEKIYQLFVWMPQIKSDILYILFTIVKRIPLELF